MTYGIKPWDMDLFKPSELDLVVRHRRQLEAADG